MKIERDLYNEFINEKTWFNGHTPIFLSNETIIMYNNNSDDPIFQIIGQNKSKGIKYLHTETLVSKTLQGALVISLLVSLKNESVSSEDYIAQNIFGKYDSISFIIDLDKEKNNEIKGIEELNNQNIENVLVRDFRYCNDDDRETVRRAFQRIVFG